MMSSKQVLGHKTIPDRDLRLVGHGEEEDLQRCLESPHMVRCSRAIRGVANGIIIQLGRDRRHVAGPAVRGRVGEHFFDSRILASYP